MTDQVIYDRGYRPYEGPRLGPTGARRAVYREGIRRLLGLGRKGRSKVFPWSMVTISIILALVFVSLHWAVGDIAESLGQGLPGYGDLFNVYSTITMIFIAFAGPTLLSPDRAQGVLSVYFSRPLTVDGYLGSKLAAFTTVVGAVYIVPQLLLHFGLALISSDGFVGYITDNLDFWWKVPVVTAGYIALNGALIFLVSAYIKRPGIAAAAYLGTIMATSTIGQMAAFTEFPGHKLVALLALDNHPAIIRDKLFDMDSGYPAQMVGHEWWVSIIAIAVVVAVATLLVRNRYRRLA